jgi:hypothetical protein
VLRHFSHILFFLLLLPFTAAAQRYSFIEYGLKEGLVQSVQIQSERGRPCVVQNPWPGQPWGVLRQGQALEALPTERAHLATQPGEILELKPLLP